MNATFSIEEVFSGRIFQVPDYQRGYAWEEQQLGDFIEDIRLLEPDHHHYTGTLVLLDRKESVTDVEGRNHKIYDVVDGQQRLTTVVIFLEALRRRLEKVNPELAAGIRKNYCELIDIHKQAQFKIRLNSDCHAYFTRNVLARNGAPNGPEIASHKRLSEALEYFEKHISFRLAAPGVGVDWLLNLYLKTIRQLRLVIYEVEHAAEVGVIFEAMNNRGKKLSEMEKVKNYLLYLATKIGIQQVELADQINRTWKRVLERLMAANLSQSNYEDQLLRAHWLTVYSPDTRGWDGLNTLRKHFSIAELQKDREAFLSRVRNYLDSLEIALVGFTDAYAPTAPNSFGNYSSETAARLRQVAEKLERLGNLSPFLPLIIAARHQWRDQPDRIVELLRTLEVYSFRVYAWSRKRSDAGNAQLAQMGFFLYGSSRELEQILKGVRATAIRHHSNDNFAFDLELESEAGWYPWSALKYFLYEYEEYLANGHTLKPNWEYFRKRDEKRTIEHILPQNHSDSYWRKQIPSAADRKRMLNDVGNLVLTEDNSSYSNKSFPLKKGTAGSGRTYSNSNLFQERELAKFEDWNRDAFEQRRDKIVKWCKERWWIDDSDLDVAPVDEQELEYEEVGAA